MLPVLTRPARRRSALLDTGILPTDVPGLTGWWKADAGTWNNTAGTTPATSDGQAVARWNDQSGSGRYWTGAGAATPTLKTGANGINGLPVLRFDGVDDTMSSVTVGFKLQDLITNAEHCLYAVVKPDVPISNQVSSWQNDAVIQDGTGNWGLHVKQTPLFIAYNYDTTEDHADATFTAGVVYGLRFRHTGGNITLLRSGLAVVTVASGNTAAAGMTGAPALGRSATNAEYWIGNLAELFVYNAQPTAGQLTGLQDYLAAKWGFTW